MTSDIATTMVWTEILARLFRRDDLSSEEMGGALSAILDGGVDPVVVAAFAAALRTKGETIEELTGLVGVLRERGERVRTDLDVVDTCGTGGDRAGTVNISTTAAFVAAGAGVPICKHGGRAASSSSGSADVLEALGVAIELGPAGVERCLSEAAFGFCFSQRFHPAMRHVASIRRAIGVATVFNFLGPLANPAGATRQVIGVSDPAMAAKLIGVLAATGTKRAMVFYGHDGLDELSTVAISTIHEITRRDDGSLEQRLVELDPRSLGLAPADAGSLLGGTPAENADRVRAVLAGERGPQRDIALLNAAAALVVAGSVSTLTDGLELAADAVDTGRATNVLDRLIEVSQAALSDELS